MPIVEKVAWDFGGPEEIAYRFPKLSLKYGSQVVVKENQWAVFFRDGKAYDVFGPGRHTITSKNIPFLTAALRALKIIGDIFECEVVFVSNSQFRGTLVDKLILHPADPYNIKQRWFLRLSALQSRRPEAIRYRVFRKPRSQRPVMSKIMSAAS